MKNLLPLSLCFALSLFFSACQGDSSQASTSQEAATSTPKHPVEDGRIIREQDESKVLSQEVATSRIEFTRTDSALIGTYLANGKDLRQEMVEEGGLSSYEAHLAKMIAIGSTQCFNLPEGQNKIVFILLNNENKLQGKIDLPCNFIRRVYSTIGAGATKDITTKLGNDDLIVTTNLLAITANKQSLFKNIVEGIQPTAYNGIEIGQKMK